MERLAEALALRRRCMTCASDPACVDGTFLHAAVIVSRSKTGTVLSYGENSSYLGDVGKWTVHAESSAISRLPSRPQRKRLVPVDMLVIRTSRTGLLGLSRPCMHCVVTMCRTLPDRGYRIDRVHYSDENRGIRVVKLQDLVCEEQHVSIYYKTRCFRRFT